MPWARLFAVVEPLCPKSGRVPAARRLARPRMLQQRRRICTASRKWVNAHIVAQRLAVGSAAACGTIVDATIIAAPEFDQERGQGA